MENKSSSEKYCLSINYNGIDYKVSVDSLETANLLINDSSAAAQYIEMLLCPEDNSEGEVAMTMYDDNMCLETASHCSNNADNNLESAAGDSQSALDNIAGDIIWTKKRPNEVDLEATAVLLSSREKLSSLFDDKKTRKMKLWNDIAKILEEKNFKLGPKGGERCRQKFSNLQKTYLAFIKHQKTTGTEGIDEVPPFFDQIHSILGGKHKVNPAALEDSLVEDHESTEVMIAEEAGPENALEQQMGDRQPENDERSSEGPKILTEEQKNLPSTSKDPNNRFNRGSRKVRPSKNNNELAKELQKDREKRNEEFDFFKSYLKKSEQQRDRFLEILQNAFPSKKRPREDSESD